MKDQPWNVADVLAPLVLEALLSAFGIVDNAARDGSPKGVVGAQQPEPAEPETTPADS